MNVCKVICTHSMISLYFQENDGTETMHNYMDESYNTDQKKKSGYDINKYKYISIK